MARAVRRLHDAEHAQVLAAAAAEAAAQKQQYEVELRALEEEPARSDATEHTPESPLDKATLAIQELLAAMDAGVALPKEGVVEAKKRQSSSSASCKLLPQLLCRFLRTMRRQMNAWRVDV